MVTTGRLPLPKECGVGETVEASMGNPDQLCGDPPLKQGQHLVHMEILT